MHIAKVPNRNARPSFLLRETYREDGKVKNRTLANLSKLPIERIETLRAALRGDPLAPIGSNGFEIPRSLPHGHVLAALTTARRIGLDDLLPRKEFGEAALLLTSIRRGAQVHPLVLRRPPETL